MLNVCRQIRHDVKGKGDEGGEQMVYVSQVTVQICRAAPLPPYNNTQKKVRHLYINKTKERKNTDIPEFNTWIEVLSGQISS